MRNKGSLVNIDKTDTIRYPNGRIKNNTGSGDGTPVNEEVYGDLHEAKDKLMRLYGISHNGLPDNETNGYQLIEAMIALATKNDFLLTLTSASDILNIPLKLSKLKDNETFILKAAFDKGDETTIRGTLDNTSKPVTFLGNFKANEYVRMINTSSSVILIRLIDSFNLEAAIDELKFLKKTTQTLEDAGEVDTSATTPLSNKTVFTKRVNGEFSSNFIAKPTGAGERNGLLSKEDKKKIDDFADPSGVIFVKSGTATIGSRQNGYNQNNYNFNYVDIYPPAGKTMANLKGFMASIAEINFSGDVNNDDTLWCRHEERANSIRIICNNSESRSEAKVNYIGIWI